jgi:hypothetical protein
MTLLSSNKEIILSNLMSGYYSNWKKAARRIWLQRNHVLNIDENEQEKVCCVFKTADETKNLQKFIS